MTDDGILFNNGDASFQLNDSDLDGMVASADARFDGWFPGMPSLNFSTDIRAVKESDG